MYIYHLIVCLALVYALYLYAVVNRKGHSQRYMFVLLGAVCFVDGILYYTYEALSPIRFQFYAFLLYFQIVYFTYYFSSYYRSKLKYFIWTLGGFVLLVVGYFQYQEASLQISKQLLLYYSCYLVVLSLIWFYKTIQDVVEKSLLQMYPFWVASTNLLWGGFYIFMAMGINYLYEYDRALSLFMGIVLSCINIVTYVGIIVGLTCVHRDAKS